MERADKNVGDDVHDVVLYPLEEALQRHPSQEMQKKRKKMQSTCFSQPTSLIACGSHEPTWSRHRVAHIVVSCCACCLLSAYRNNILANFACSMVEHVPRAEGHWSSASPDASWLRPRFNHCYCHHWVKLRQTHHWPGLEMHYGSSDFWHGKGPWIQSADQQWPLRCRQDLFTMLGKKSTPS